MFTVYLVQTQNTYSPTSSFFLRIFPRYFLIIFTPKSNASFAPFRYFTFHFSLRLTFFSFFLVVFRHFDLLNIRGSWNYDWLIVANTLAQLCYLFKNLFYLENLIKLFQKSFVAFYFYCILFSFSQPPIFPYLNHAFFHSFCTKEIPNFIQGLFFLIKYKKLL